MIASMQSQGRSITGIRIGTSEARRNFPHGAKAIDLELDHLCIRCDLHTNSLRDRTEISDRRLCAWLEEKFYWQKLPPSPVAVEMVRSGNSYRLQLVPLRQPVKRGFGLNV
jgi:hypothetical protein